ncbi:MAG: bifunctional glutamate N-acetyltransferase/amino-acid acetyltransferase ArgJ [Candidatus Methanosuratincola sp.]|jgi:glutamate N-acetyltransferase/amino-acid N-acetyltransferase
MIRVPGFLACGISSGLKKTGKPDLGLIYSEKPARAAAVFTKNVVKAAPVIVGMERIRSGLCQAVVVNSGNANACTGKRGIEDSIAITRLVAEALDIDESMVIPSSTGVIGVPLPVEKIKNAIPALVSSLSEDGLLDLSKAIMTTDQYPKYAEREVEINGRRGRICVIGKGAGMIAPNMATMLAFILTDICVELGALRRALHGAVDETFNRIIVDGDTSTNDTAIILANGFLGNEELKEGDSGYEEFTNSLTEVCRDLSRMIVTDGEGATKAVTIRVCGARTDKEAELVARTVGSSLLVKSALYGEDANWGRFLAAAGRAGVGFNPDAVDLFFDSHLVVKDGVEVAHENEYGYVFKKPEFTVTLDLKLGSGSAYVLASDISIDYLRLNAHYRT